jgi:hypothetical protein
MLVAVRSIEAVPFQEYDAINIFDPLMSAAQRVVTRQSYKSVVNVLQECDPVTRVLQGC